MALPANPHLLLALVLCIAVLAIADYLWRGRRLRRARKQRLMARIDQLNREAMDQRHRAATARANRSTRIGAP